MSWNRLSPEGSYRGGMRREVRLAWAAANVLLAVGLLASLVVDTTLTLPLLAVAIAINAVATAVTS